MKSELLLYRFRKICSRAVFILYIIIFLIVILFPPYYLRNYHGYEISLGFHFILTPPLFVNQYPGSIDSNAFFIEFLFLVFFGYILVRFFGWIIIGAEYKGRRQKEIETLESEKVMQMYIISNLWEHILYDRFSVETLKEAYDFEYVSIIERSEKLPFWERNDFQMKKARLIPHLAEMAVISAILDDVDRYDKLVDYLYLQELDSFDSLSSACYWVEKAADILPRSVFNDDLCVLAKNYLDFSHINKRYRDWEKIEEIENRLNVFNAMEECRVT